MDSDNELAHVTKSNLRGLEIEASDKERAVTVTFLNDTLRSKIIYLFFGTVLLAAWWLVYDNFLPFSRLVTYHVLPLREGTHLGATVEFFIFEVPKVLLLLTLIVFFVGVITVFFHA